MKDEVPEPWWREWPLALAVLTLTLALLGRGWIATALDQPVMLVVWLAVICGVILTAAIAIVRHAEELAHRLGEPAGTLLLTLAITGLEVCMVAFVMSMVGTLLTALVVAREWERGTMESMLASPARMGEMIAARLI